MTSESGSTSLQDRWTHIYRKHLPELAKARDPVQPTWPVYLDHCFARICLDNAVGVDRPWTEVVKAPAVKNMTDDQLKAAIWLAERIATGEEDLVELDDNSLALRGKNGKRKRVAGDVGDDAGAKKKAKEAAEGEGTISRYFLPSPKSTIKGEDDSVNRSHTTDTKNEESKQEGKGPGSQRKSPIDADMTHELQRIASSNITAFRKQTLSMLCHIPRGRYTTYQAMSDYISKTSHKTCARAVGNAMRNNPFAPEVPCHRVLAADGSLGGFKGSWGEEGKYASDKKKLLGEEGVRFDSRGKVKGAVFREFGD